MPYRGVSDCMTSLGERFPQLRELLHRFGSTQIRNQGTVGGNIANASPVGDLPPVLLALDASLVLCSQKGEREVLLSEFFTAYKTTVMQSDEYIHSILIPNINSFRAEPAPAKLKIYKISKRFDDDISAVCAVFNLITDNKKISSIKIALGGMAATPARAPSLEQTLLGLPIDTKWTDDVRQRVHAAIGADFTPISDARAGADYRSQVTANLVKRLLLEVNQVPDTQVLHYV